MTEKRMEDMIYEALEVEGALQKPKGMTKNSQWPS